MIDDVRPVPIASVVIPTWNGAHLLPTCLDALRRQTMSGFETLVVDGGSTDDTRDVLSCYPEVGCVALERNMGFAAAVNAGIRSTRAMVIVLLNNDTEAEPDWLRELLIALLSDPGIGMATSKVRLFDRRDILHTTGDTVDRAGFPANRGVWERDCGQFDDLTDVFSASGAAAAYRRSMLTEVGRFEEKLGSYLEDVDLAWRARLAGWRCVYAPRAVVYHRLSATGGGPLASYLVARNRVWLIARNYPLRMLVSNWRSVVRAQVAELERGLRGARGSAARATVRGLLVGWLTWPRMLPERRRIQRTRRISDRELETMLAPMPRHTTATGPE